MNATSFESYVAPNDDDNGPPDYTLRYGTREWHIHKDVVDGNSSVLGDRIYAAEEDESYIADEPMLCIDETFEADGADAGDSIKAKAFDCMVSYFYSGGYDVAKFEGTCASPIHAYVFIIAKKYSCDYLVDLAYTEFIATMDNPEFISSIKLHEWLDIIALVYRKRGDEFCMDPWMRRGTLDALAQRPAMLRALLKRKDMKRLLRRNAILATSLLLRTSRTIALDPPENIFVCGKCRYTHVGPVNCAYMADTRRRLRALDVYPQCESVSVTTPETQLYTVGRMYAFPCHDCRGLHIVESVLEPPPDAEIDPDMELDSTTDTDFDPEDESDPETDSDSETDSDLETEPEAEATGQ